MPTPADTFALAWQHHQAGRLGEAQQLYEQVLQAEPANADAWCFLGAAFQAQAKLEQAESHLRRAVQLLPRHGSAQNYLGIVLAQQGRLAEAATRFQMWLAMEPGDAEAHNNLGLVLAQQGREKEAIACYQKALQLRGDFKAARDNLNKAWQRQPGARAPVAAPPPAQVFPPTGNVPEMAYHANKRGVALAQEGKLDEAIASFNEVLRLQPGNADAYNNLATVYDIRMKYDDALAHYEKALQIKPDHVEAHYNIGTVLDKIGKPREAIVSYQRALTLQPSHLDARNNLGNALKNCGRMDEALANIEQTLRMKPDYGEGHLSRGVLWLLQGDFARGLPEYEWRWKRAGFTERTFPQPKWQGEELHGKTILLFAEQGHGDTLQFVRYAPLVKQRGGRVIVECQPELARLLASAEGIDELVPQGSPLPAFDVQAPLPGLPGIFRTVLETIPASKSYLRADAQAVEHWARELAPLKGFKIGICWQGNPAYRDDRQRSIALTRFGQLAAVQGVQLISLQKGSGTDQLRALAGKFSVADFESRLGPDAESFMSIAAIMKNIDLVVSCDTAVAHLAGALGVPVWLAAAIYARLALAAQPRGYALVSGDAAVSANDVWGMGRCV